MKPKAEALRFLRALYGRDCPGWLALWARGPDGATTHWVRATELEEAADKAVALAGEADVYFGVCPQEQPLGKRRRGGADTVVAVPGLWADIDVAGPAHKQGLLPPTRDAAYDLLARLPRCPDIIVDSGHGYQAYWTYKDLWKIDSEHRRIRAEALAWQWQTLIRNRAECSGWHLDSTADLARVFRMPGTRNHKGMPRPVYILECHRPKRTWAFDLEAYETNMSLWWIERFVKPWMDRPASLASSQGV